RAPTPALRSRRDTRNGPGHAADAARLPPDREKSASREIHHARAPAALRSGARHESRPTKFPAKDADAGNRGAARRAEARSAAPCAAPLQLPPRERTLARLRAGGSALPAGSIHL